YSLSLHDALPIYISCTFSSPQLMLNVKEISGSLALPRANAAGSSFEKTENTPSFLNHKNVADIAANKIIMVHCFHFVNRNTYKYCIDYHSLSSFILNQVYETKHKL